MTDVNYRFNITFSGTYNAVNGYIKVNSDVATHLYLRGDTSTDLISPGTLSFTDSTVTPVVTYANSNFCRFANQQTTSSGGVYVTKVNTQTSTSSPTLQVDLGDVTSTSGSLILEPGFITPTPDGTLNWILQTVSSGTPSAYTLDIYSWDGTKATLIEPATYTFTTSAALNPACFIEGTKLFAHVHDKDVYVNIEDLRTGDLVNTHLHGKKAIKFIGKGSLTNNPSVWNHCVRRLPKSGDATDDLLVTGAHSILVDELSAEETEGMSAIYGTADRKIDDKVLVNAWVSNKFEAVDDNNEYTYYHLVLEHDSDENKRYGIWANGVLTESQSEKHFLEKPYELL
jgi:hypothetical protein